MPKPQYYSQYAQDKFLDRIVFGKKRQGFFVDIGAHDGISFSNSYFFERERGWDGICFEPNPTVFLKLKENRSCDVKNACISNKNASVQFLSISGWAEMLSGIVDNYDLRHMERVDRAIAEYGGSKKTIEVQSLKFDGSSFALPAHIDYCNIDTEGSEMEVLKGIDFDALSINVFSIENNYNSTVINNFMLGKGYILIKTLGDEIYIKKEAFSYRIKCRMYLEKVKVQIGIYKKRLIGSRIKK